MRARRVWRTMSVEMTSRRVWSRGLVVAGLVALAVVLRFTAFAPASIPVRVVAIEKGRVEETVTNSRAGTVKARRRAKLAPEIGGKVLSLPRRRGALVRRGDLLLRVDDALQRAQLRVSEDESKAASAQREQACLAAERSARELERTRSLAAQGIVSADLIDAVDSQSRTAAAGCRAARAAFGPRGLRGGPSPRPARQDRAAGSLRRRRRRHLHRGGRVDLALAAGAADPPDPRPHRHRARST